LPNESGGQYAGIPDLAAMGGGIAAVHAPASEIDNDIGTVDTFGPGAQFVTGPMNGLPFAGFRITGDYSNKMTLFLKMAGEDGAHLSSTSGDYDVQRLLEQHTVERQ
jgi:hypothetical protein